MITSNDMTIIQTIKVIFITIFTTLFIAKLIPDIFNSFDIMQILFIILLLVFWYMLDTRRIKLYLLSHKKIKTESIKNEKITPGEKFMLRDDIDSISPVIVKVVFVDYKLDEIHFIFLTNGNEKYKLSKEIFLKTYEPYK